MTKYELFLLGGSYQRVGDDPVIELFGRSRTGEPVVARYEGFLPYFQLTDPTTESLDRLRADRHVV